MMWIRWSLVIAGMAAPAYGQVSWSFGDTVYPAGASASCLAVGDVDGDNKPDVIYGRSSDGQVFLRKNDGTGQLGPALGLGTLGGVSSMALGDIDGDAVLDLVLASETGDTMEVLLGHGTGGFTAQPAVGIPGKPVDLQLADLDGDGTNEIVIADRANVRILAAAYPGLAQPFSWVASAMHEAPTNFAIGDLNGDGKLDVVSSGVNAGNGSILLGKAGLDFRPPSYLPSAFGGGPIWIELGDFNGDGKLDAVSTEDDGLDADLVVWEGNGDGTFGAELWYTLTSNYRGENSVGDFNGDGNPDLVGSVWNAKLAGLVGTGGTTMWPTPAAMVGPQLSALESVDLNGDLVDDLVVLDEQLGTLTVMISQPEQASSYLNQMAVLSSNPKKHHLSMQLGGHGGHPYLVLGTLSGTTPGVDLGAVHIALNPDAYTTLLFTKPGTLIADSFGFLNAYGAANVTLNAGTMSLSPGLVGLTAHHAFLVLSPLNLSVTWASEPLQLLLQ